MNSFPKGDPRVLQRERMAELNARPDMAAERELAWHARKGKLA